VERLVFEPKKTKQNGLTTLHYVEHLCMQRCLK